MKIPDGHDMIRRRFLKSALLGGVGLAAGRIRALSPAANAVPKPLTLVKQGKSSYSICVSETASPSEKHAAEELQRFL